VILPEILVNGRGVRGKRPQVHRLIHGIQLYADPMLGTEGDEVSEEGPREAGAARRRRAQAPIRP
jgi:hypothetical protein